jgi:hypothetical protein
VTDLARPQSADQQEEKTAEEADDATTALEKIRAQSVDSWDDFWADQR